MAKVRGSRHRHSVPLSDGYIESSYVQESSTHEEMPGESLEVSRETEEVEREGGKYPKKRQQHIHRVERRERGGTEEQHVPYVRVGQQHESAMKGRRGGNDPIEGAENVRREREERRGRSNHFPPPTHVVERDAGRSSTTVFYSMITPLSDLKGRHTGLQGQVEFKVKMSKGVVILQWEPFTGRIAATGICKMDVCQSIHNLPAYDVFGDYWRKYKGDTGVSCVKVNSCTSRERASLSFYTTSTCSEASEKDDYVEVMGGTISWVL